MGNQPKVKELMEGILTCPACSAAVHISDYKGLEMSPCPQCDAPLFIPLKLKNYWLYKPLGGGGMGSVYQALSEDSSGEYAIKILPREQNTNQELINSITNEGEIGILLGKAPNIAEVVEYGCEDGEYFLASRFAEGTRLDIFISTASHLSERQALDIILQVIDAEIHMINCGFLFRDIKPENIIVVEETGLVKVFDFGLCLSLEQAAHPDPADDALEGSPYYLPPERIVAAAEGEHSEVYSLGMLLFHMLSGTTYFSQSDIKNLLTKHVGGLRVGSVATRLKHCSPEIATILDKMIKRDPNQRYHELAPLKQELEDLCNAAEGYSLTESSNASGNIPPKGVANPEKKKSSKTTLIALLTVLVITAIGVGGWHIMNSMAENSRRQEILTETAARLGIDKDVKPPALTPIEVNNLISEKLNQEYDNRKNEFPPFNEKIETANACKKLSISVSMRKDSKYTLSQLNKMAVTAVKKDAQRKLLASRKTFSEEKEKEDIAKKMGVSFPIKAPTRTLKEIKILLAKDADQATKKKYPSKIRALKTMDILKKYRSYKIGEKVTILDQAGMKTSGAYKGKEGNKVVIGTRKLMLADIVASERIKFNESLCNTKASKGIERIKNDFNKKRLEYKKEYIAKVKKDIYIQYGYMQDKDQWVAVNVVIDTKLKYRKQKFTQQQHLQKKKIEQASKKDFNKDAFIKKHGFCKIKGKWHSEKAAVDKLLKEKRDIFNQKRNKALIKLKAELKHNVEKEVYADNRYIYYNDTWQPAVNVLNTECQKTLFNTME